jgi:hypothetical protein
MQSKLNFYLHEEVRLRDNDTASCIILEGKKSLDAKNIDRFSLITEEDCFKRIEAYKKMKIAELTERQEKILENSNQLPKNMAWRNSKANPPDKNLKEQLHIERLEYLDHLNNTINSGLLFEENIRELFKLSGIGKERPKRVILETKMKDGKSMESLYGELNCVLDLEESMTAERIISTVFDGIISKYDNNKNSVEKIPKDKHFKRCFVECKSRLDDFYVQNCKSFKHGKDKKFIMPDNPYDFFLFKMLRVCLVCNELSGNDEPFLCVLIYNGVDPNSFINYFEHIDNKISSVKDSNVKEYLSFLRHHLVPIYVPYNKYRLTSVLDAYQKALKPQEIKLTSDILTDAGESEAKRLSENVVKEDKELTKAVTQDNNLIFYPYVNLHFFI